MLKLTEVLDFILTTHGRIFSIEFIKRTTGEKRLMVCRTGVSKGVKGVGRRFDTVDKGLVPVFDMQKDQHRMIPLEGIRRVKIDGQWHEVEQSWQSNSAVNTPSTAGIIENPLEEFDKASVQALSTAIKKALG